MDWLTNLTELVTDLTDLFDLTDLVDWTGCGCEARQRFGWEVSEVWLEVIETEPKRSRLPVGME